MDISDNYFFENDLLRYESYLKGFNSSIFKEFNSKFEELNVNSKIEDLFAGKNVNYTENQAAWHPKYRANIPNWPSSDLSECLNKGLLDGVLNVIVLGIGGSFEGPKLLVESLIGSSSDLNHLFITGSDPEEFKEKTSNLKKTETLFIVSSKSFKTDETLQTLEDAIKWSGDINKFIASRDIMYREVSCKIDSDLENIFCLFIEELLSKEYINICKGVQETNEVTCLINDKNNDKNNDKKQKKCCYIF